MARANAKYTITAVDRTAAALKKIRRNFKRTGQQISSMGAGLAMERRVMVHANRHVSGDTIGARRAGVQQRGAEEEDREHGDDGGGGEAGEGLFRRQVAARHQHQETEKSGEVDRQLLGQEGLQPHVLQADGVEHARRRLAQADRPLPSTGDHGSVVGDAEPGADTRLLIDVL